MMEYAWQEFAGLPTIVAESKSENRSVKTDSALRAIVLLHGYGANAQDLAPLAEVLAVAGNVRWLFPQGPLALDSYGSRAWWQIDIAALESAMATGRQRDRRLENPPGLGEARQRVEALLGELELPLEQVVIGGFSQGAMLATDLVLHAEANPAGLLLFSGTLLAEDVWRERAPARRGLRFFQSHGQADPLLPFSAAQDLHGLLRDSGLTGEFVSFAGGHTIPPEALEGAARFLATS